MADNLEERLKSHARAFDGLLSLIPAKLYYGEDNSDQWQRKKQTKEQKKAARLAKLDPDNAKSAKDVMDERAVAAAKKRKRDEDDEEAWSDFGVGLEKPREGLNLHQQQPKKLKTQTEEQKSQTRDIKPAAPTETTEDDRKRRKADKKAAKKERKKIQKEKSKAKRERQKERKAEAVANEPTEGSDSEEWESADDDNEDGDMAEAIDIRADKPTAITEAPSTASPSPAPDSPQFDSPHVHSTSSSISSIQPPTAATDPKLSKPISSKPTSGPKPSASEIRARLQSRIEALRTARKADGPDGRPARSRQELLEARRKKEVERKAHKKELRRKAKEEEARKRDEEIAARFSPGGSGSLLASPRSPMPESANNSFSFGRIAFSDGTQADATLSNVIDPHSTKGPSNSDTRAALLAAEKKSARISALDPAARAEIEQKDMWLNARKRAHGQKVKDDTSLLKKALKRQEGKKGKSEKDWKGRTEGVEKAMKERQRKREENLRNRREEKGSKGKGGKKAGSGGKRKEKVKVNRPGFEGSFRTKGGRK